MREDRTTSEIMTFEKAEFGTIRTVELDGRIMFCGVDAARALGYKNTSKALSDHCKGITNRYPLETSGGTQNARFKPKNT